jgi:tetratricopeptide (TPR) repeat protein
MPELHPSRETLEAFAFGDLSKLKSRTVIQHLMGECESCQRVSSELWNQLKLGLRGAGRAPERAPAEEAVLADSPYKEALDRAAAEASGEQSRLEIERVRAELLCDELFEHPQPRRITLVRNSRRFQIWALSERLIEQSFACRFDRPGVGVELAQLAVAQTESLDPEAYGDAAVNDQLGRAWAYLGNALRVQTDLRDADEAFAESKKCFEQGSQEDLDRALWLRFHSHLLTIRSQFEAARGEQDQAIAIYRRYGQLANAAMLQSDQAVSILYSGNPEAALPKFHQALELSVAQGDERRVAMSHHNLASCLLELERYDEALEELEVSSPVLRRLGDTLSLVRADWLRAKIQVGRENYEAAEWLLIQVSDTFVREGIGYDAALSSLELATIYAAQSRTAELKELIQTMLPIFQSQDVHREALAALIVFRQAVEEESLTLARLESILGYLHRARNKPELRFDDTA